MVRIVLFLCVTACYQDTNVEAYYPPSGSWESAIVVTRPANLQDNRFRVRFTYYPQYCTSRAGNYYSNSNSYERCVLRGDQVRTVDTGTPCFSSDTGGGGGGDVVVDGGSNDGSIYWILGIVLGVIACCCLAYCYMVGTDDDTTGDATPPGSPTSRRAQRMRRGMTRTVSLARQATLGGSKSKFDWSWTNPAALTRSMSFRKNDKHKKTAPSLWEMAQEQEEGTVGKKSTSKSKSKKKDKKEHKSTPNTKLKK